QDAPDFPKRIAGKIASSDAPEVILAMPGYEDPDYQKVSALAEAIRAGVGDRPVYVCLQQDMAKALGQRLGLMLPEGRPCICLDRLHFAPESYLDIGAPVGPCYPVVIKTLVLAGK
ncbi:MAG: ethanolamine ammonia-lyase reactivating factor EutA, partial [Oscillospiraceae bacterium]|nr:ethanolamine ammonia-lyase reactivating factor EutA [Oscillospiraceae bacterium]